MSFLDLFHQSAQQHSGNGRIFGVVVALVTNNKDPDGLGRVKVKFPWLSDVDESAWARVAAPMAGNQRGIYFLPEVDDEVLVAFEHGNVRVPYVLGALWNGRDAPPGTNADGKNNVRMIKSRSGHVVKLNDEDGKETIEIVDKNQKNSIVIDTSKGTVTVTADQGIALSASNGTIKIDAQKVQINSTDAMELKAGGNMNAEASGTMTVKGATVNIN
jgi:uncharacterized protein involved in type VI secretion and phage assembly